MREMLDMKIIFLDLDGVIHHYDKPNPNPQLKWIDELATHQEIGIVFTTDHQASNPFHKLVAMLKPHLPHVNFIGGTFYDLKRNNALLWTLDDFWEHPDGIKNGVNYANRFHCVKHYIKENNLDVQNCYFLEDAFGLYPEVLAVYTFGETYGGTDQELCDRINDSHDYYLDYVYPVINTKFHEINPYVAEQLMFELPTMTLEDVKLAREMAKNFVFTPNGLEKEMLKLLDNGKIAK